VISGQQLDVYLREHVLGPLDMRDTGFVVSDAQLSRFAANYERQGDGTLKLIDGPERTQYRSCDFFSGGGGLVSTAHDYLRFCQMLLNGGELDGVRVLAPQTVQQMTVASLPPDIRFAGVVGGFMGPNWGSSWGLGFAVRTDRKPGLVPGRVGSFTWGGLWETKFWIDPAEKLAVVQMIQVEPDHPEYWQALARFTYDSLRASR